MEKADSGWKVYDVTIDGASLVTTYRGSFNDQIQKGGIDALVKTLADRNTGPGARSQEVNAPKDEALALVGALSFDTLPKVLEESAQYAARTDLPDRLTIDFAAITSVDSSAVALLLEWRRQALQKQQDPRVREPPREPPRARRPLRRGRTHPDAGLGWRPRPSRFARSRSASAACARSPAFRSPWSRASSSRSSGPTAPARPRSSPRSAASPAPTRASLAVMGHDVERDFRAARRAVGIVPQEIVFDPFFTVRETLEIQSGYFGLRNNGAWIDELLERLALAPKARREHARALGRHEAPRDGGAGAGAPPAGDRARRADRRASTSSCARRSGASSADSTRPATPSCSPPTTSRRRSSCARASR